MKIRQLTCSDIEAAADLNAAAWLNSPVNEYLYPRRHQHPKAYRHLYARSIKEVLGDEECSMIVVEMEPSDERWTGKPDIVGYASYTTEENDPSKDSWLKRLRNRLPDFDLKEDLYVLFNPAASLLRDRRYGTADTVYFDKADKEPNKYLSLGMVSVDPGHRREGIGLLMVQYLLQRAQEAELPIVLYSTADGRKLYEKAGFRHFGTWHWAKGKDQFMSAMRWDPPTAGKG